MAIQFIGHTSNFAIWAFNINGKKFVGRNFSTETPRLALRWNGVIDDNDYNRIKSTVGWVKPEDYGSSGFAITNSTATTVDWVWRGVPYRSFYTVTEEEDEVGELFYQLTFGAPTNLAEEATKAAEAARLKQAESDRSAAEARAMQAEADRVAAETRRKQEEANKAAEAAKNAKSQIAPPTGLNWVTLGLQLGAAYLLLS